MDNTPFLKENKKKYVNVFYFSASSAFVDDKGNPIEWKFRRLYTTDERELCKLTNEKALSLVDILGGAKTMHDQLLYMRNKLVMACIYPNLTDRELQKSYGVDDEYELFDQLLNDPEEFSKLVLKYNEEFSSKKEWFGNE